MGLSIKLLIKIIDIKNIIIIGLVILFSCNNENHIRVYKIVKEKNLNQKEVIKISEENNSNFSWEKPSDWVEVQGHSMRIASFNVPFSNGIGDLSITSFGGASGGIKANINRWEKQLDLASSPLKDINKISQSRRGKLGEYQVFKLMNPEKKEMAIIASIFKLKETTLFIKLSIALKGIDEVEELFIDFCNSINFTL